MYILTFKCEYLTSVIMTSNVMEFIRQYENEGFILTDIVAI